MAITDYSGKPHKGMLCLVKASGEVANGYALATQKNIPFTDFETVELENNTYPGSGNAAAGSVLVAPGLKAYLHTIQCPCHATWYEQKLINDLIGGSDSFLTTSAPTQEASCWDLSRYEPVLGHKKYAVSALVSIATVYSAAGGPISSQLQFVSLYGPGDGSPGSFSTPTPLTGTAYGRKSFTSASFDLDRSFVLTVMRARIVQPIADGTDNGVAITTGPIGGTLSIEEATTAEQGTLLAATSGTRNGTAVLSIGASTTGVQWTCYVNRDSRRTRMPGNAPDTMFFDYSLANVGYVGSTGYPFVLIAKP